MDNQDVLGVENPGVTCEPDADAVLTDEQAKVESTEEANEAECEAPADGAAVVDAPQAENVADTARDTGSPDEEAVAGDGMVVKQDEEPEELPGDPEPVGKHDAEDLMSGGQDEAEDVADIDLDDIVEDASQPEDINQDVSAGQSESRVLSDVNPELDDTIKSLDDSLNEIVGLTVEDEASLGENSAGVVENSAGLGEDSVDLGENNAASLGEDSVSICENSAGLGEDSISLGENSAVEQSEDPGESDKLDNTLVEEVREGTDPVCNTDNIDSPKGSSVNEEAGDDFDDQIIETGDPESSDKPAGVDVIEKGQESAQLSEDENNASQSQEAFPDLNSCVDDDDAILESTEGENPDTAAQSEGDIHDQDETKDEDELLADDDDFDIRESVVEQPDKDETQGERDTICEPAKSEEQSDTVGDVDASSNDVEDEGSGADIDEMDIREAEEESSIVNDADDNLNDTNDKKSEAEEMDVEMTEEADSQHEITENSDDDEEELSNDVVESNNDTKESPEDSVDASEQMDVSHNEMDDDLVEMDADISDIKPLLLATEAEDDGVQDKVKADEPDVKKDISSKVAGKSADTEKSTDLTDKKSGETAAEAEEKEDGKEMEVDQKSETDGKLKDKVKTEPEDSPAAAELPADQDQKLADDKETTTTTSDAKKLDIKKEAIENSKKSEKTESGTGLEKQATSESGDSSELKIVGVTSSAGVDEKGDSEGKGGDSNDLNLKISSVTGAGDAEEKKDQDIEKVEANEIEKTEKSLTTDKDAKKDKDTSDKKSAKKEGKPEDDDVIAIREEKKPAPKPKASKIQKCIVCSKVGKCKYNIVRNGDVKHLCDDTCFKRFRSSPTTYLKSAETTPKPDKPTQNNVTPSSAIQKAPVTAAALKSSAAPPQPYKTCNVCQLMNVRTSKPFLNWQGLDFCGEECLGKFQANLSVTCSYCSSQIHQTNKAKFCWRVGSEMKHFCSATCNNEFSKRMKLCAFCNKDLAAVVDSFMAPVGDKGTFKDFCSQKCLQQFEEKNSQDFEVTKMENGKASVPPKGNFLCAVCGKTGPVKHELKHDGKSNRLCSDPCFSAFQYANKLTINPCFNCGTSCQADAQTSQFIQFEGQQKRFCSFMCVNTFRNKFKKTVPCAWCAAKKNNFDMIERVDANNKYQLFCSLNCLSLYRVNLQATSNQAVMCDQCRKFVPAQYHLTMSDASVRNFCSYGCVMQFQAQFQTPKPPSQSAIGAGLAAKQVLTPQQQTTTRSGRVVKAASAARQQLQLQQPEPIKPSPRGNRSNSDSFPIISNVVSLAPKGPQQQINIKSATGVTVTDQQGVKTTTTTTGNQTVQQQIIIQPPPPKGVKNKSLLCKPFVQTKATSCRPHTQTKETQTDGKIEPDKYLVPVPVPIYCPTPLPMYTMPTPILVPVPIPIPIPVFIPTTKKSIASIMKRIKEIQEKIPADPLEAELLMMAEAVAGKEESSSSESDDGGDAPEVTPVKEPPTNNPPPQGDLGEDMLQMALRMASEMSDEPVMDLETSLEPVAVSTVPPPVPAAPVEPPPQVDDDDDYSPAGQRQTRRSRGGVGGGGNKRASRNTPRRGAKRQKVETQPELQEPTPSPPQPAAPPLDANFHLKYTYGVNAFKHWVMQKNSAIEQQAKTNVGKTLKTFKLDILQCTSDELNHSLCLFVKEVRKPNGEMYAVDSIYYLTLGIQQYLFENGRIDNIFTDFYYERFTECLNELLTRYEPKLNHAGQLVCRIEEEHLWESKQLGAHSPYVLLNSLVYFNTKYFMLKTSEDHLKLSFTHIMKHWKKNPCGRGSGTGPNVGRSVYLRYYCPAPAGKGGDANKKKKEEMPVYEQTENLDNPLRCPVKLYEFYLSKCPESIKNRNDTFYLVPERSCVPDSPVWYSTAMLGIDQMAKMLNRIRLVREIQEAHLHTQPIFI